MIRLGLILLFAALNYPPTHLFAFNKNFSEFPVGRFDMSSATALSVTLNDSKRLKPEFTAEWVFKGKGTLNKAVLQNLGLINKGEPTIQELGNISYRPISLINSEFDVNAECVFSLWVKRADCAETMLCVHAVTGVNLIVKLIFDLSTIIDKSKGKSLKTIQRYAGKICCDSRSAIFNFQRKLDDVLLT